MIPQSAWRRRYVVPIAKEAGLVPEGSVFRMLGERGDCAVLELQAHPMDPKLQSFFVRVSVVPLTERAWTQRQHWEEAKDHLPGSGSGMLRWEVAPPAAVAFDSLGDSSLSGLWTYGAGVEPDECAAQLVDVLREHTFPAMRRFLDRDALAAEMRQRSGHLRHHRPAGWAATLLNVDRLSPVALEPLLQTVESDYPLADEFVAWAREYAARHNPAG
ncbi:hypothetical protein C5L38_34810 (plasmid) [Streptomyces sp. WAC00288]|uniref:hypothetical protein n=1 Tax=unclassified Streptomyces TaxID=2593676 RepID=UPI0007868ECD|nr:MULTISPECIES: hypothetical protein [unclassified Streptomyces]AVI00225.1 hypothetical protein C5L38_34810 [Streptomyces sp. WAC00288]KYG51059.1 hypothetical protein AWI43_31845 [Streptomyces sp. WAC04657]